MDKPMTSIVDSKTNEIALTCISREIIRKSLHSLIAVVPILAILNKSLTFSLLVAGICIYTISEFFRLIGKNDSILARIILLASRSPENNRPVLGPLTLALGAILAISIFPLKIASIAILALAFGDGIASIAGMKFSSFTIPFTKGKTFAGSFTCFIVIYLLSFTITMSVPQAFLLASVGTLIEVLPLGDFDNIAIPVGVGLAAWCIGV